ncbi:hypothetical protein GOP47_0008936 [Adiantum capillus-veneris]|uniref:Pentatricopeptide repeat-containing protein n=1 Tax=Adiantum capillus-veneris TaxID=13818 RepID=A0A9D4ZKU6_ADICA|nr:hypothetical protein GOP47_0008936 [Adiantum capillus-veneris]
MICPSAELLGVEFHCPSRTVEREGPGQLPLAEEEWRWVGKGSRHSKLSVQCFLSSPSSNATIPAEFPRDRRPCWLQEELIVPESRQVEVENGELCTERGGLTMIDGEPCAETVASESAEAMDLGRDREPCMEKTTEQKACSEGMILEMAPEEDLGLKDSALKPQTVPQNDVAHFVGLLKKCAEQRDLQKGIVLHADLIGLGLLHSSVIVGNTLINMYAKCGDIKNAEKVFDRLPARSVASWNILISRSVQCGHDDKALYYYRCMQLEGFYPDAVTYVCMLKAFGSLRDFDKGQEIHARLIRDGLLEINVHVGTALVDMYGKCGCLSKAQEVFDKLPDRNVISWTALIIGYTQDNCGEEALRCFEQMQLEGFSPDEFTFACAIKACCSTGDVVKGKEIHAWVARECLLENNMVIASALVDMYTKCGELELAQGVFDSVPSRDKVSWTALITGYALHGYGEAALTCYNQMLLGGFLPNELTFSGLLKACTSLGALDKGQEIHAQIIREGLLDKDVHLGTALVDMYGKCGSTAIAKEVFENLVGQDVATWTAMITAFVQHEQVDEAFDFFKRMQSEGIYPDAITFSCILIACGSVGSAEKGQRLHIEVIKLGLVEEDMVVGTALVDMYANCGMMLEAQDIFDKLEVRDLILRCVLIGGYAQLGDDEAVFKLIDDMIMEGEEPNAAVFVIILNTCSHRGLSEKGQNTFKILSKNYGFSDIEQHTCMVDLFGRSGQVEKAAMMIREMPFHANLTLWTTLLSACEKWGNVKCGRWAFDQAICEDDKDASPYICMRNLYAAAGRKEDATKIEKMQFAKQAWRLNEVGLTFLID